MLVINARNVNEALPLGIMHLKAAGKEVAPRGLKTIEYPTPVCTVYKRPWERVLLEPLRDANHIFHLMESLWILGGRNDVSFPCMFNSKLAQYSDNSLTFHGAYGHRLRSCGKDQLKEVVKILQKDPDTRKAVLQIWDYKKDLGYGGNDLPCNDLIIFKIRDGRLNMTVCNRSNDIIWGCYGANAVQFSYIQEYVAAMVGCAIGEYRQVSDSFHAYLDNPQWEQLQNISPNDVYNHAYYPMIEEPTTFDIELKEFLEGQRSFFYDNRFFSDVAVPMYNTWFAHKETRDGAFVIDQILDTAWRQGVEQWLAKRGDK